MNSQSKLAARRFLLLAALLGAVFSAGMRSQAEEPASAMTAPLARYVPRDKLVMLAEFDGFDAHEKSWKGSSAYKLLNETKLGSLLEDLIEQGLAIARENPAAGDSPIKGTDSLALLKFIARGGFVLATVGEAPKYHLMLVVRRGDRPEVRRFLKLIADANEDETAKAANAQPIQKSGRTLFTLGREDAYWFEKGDLVLTQRELADEILATLDGQGPSALENPIRAELARNEADFDSIARAFVDFASLPGKEKRPGWESIRRLDLRWGIQDDALLGRYRMVVPEPRNGFPGLFDQPYFEMGSLPPIPAGQTSFNVLSLDAEKFYDQIVGFVKRYSTTGDKSVVMFETFMTQTLGMSLRNQLLPLVGPKISLYIQAQTPPGQSNPSLAMLNEYAGLTLSVQVRDFDALSKKLGTNIESVNKLLKDRAVANTLVNQPEPPVPSFRKLDKPDPTYLFEFPQGSVPPIILSLINPTLTLGKDQLVLSMTTKGAEKARGLGSASPENRWKADGDFAPLGRRLPKNLVFLSVSDPRETMPALIANLPAVLESFNAGIKQSQRQAGNPATGIPLKIDRAKLPSEDELKPLLFPSALALNVDKDGVTFLVREPIPSLASPGTSGVLVALLLPAVQSAREAARRIQCSNNLKQLTLGMMNYEEKEHTFPRQAITDKDGKPLLSWRVAILPYLGQSSLYEKFKLDEPWDSPHNRKLLDEMPVVYRCPSSPVASPTVTNYRVVVGPGGIFDGGKPSSLASITDGMANTLLIVETTEPVEWTKPEELSYNPADEPSLLGAGSIHPNVFQAAHADGSIHVYQRTLDPKVFRALITKAGGEILPKGQ